MAEIKINAPKRSFVIVAPRGPRGPSSAITWDDGTPILWDDNSPILWDSVTASVILNAPKRSFVIVAPKVESV